MKNHFIESITNKLDSLYSNAGRQLDCLDTFDETIQREVVAEILGYACQAQNNGNIMAARKLLALIPTNCLSAVLDAAVQKQLDLEDEWEYRRLLEALNEINQKQLANYVKMGLISELPEIREAAHDYKSS